MGGQQTRSDPKIRRMISRTALIERAFEALKFFYYSRKERNSKYFKVTLKTRKKILKGVFSRLKLLHSQRTALLKFSEIFKHKTLNHLTGALNKLRISSEKTLVKIY